METVHFNSESEHQPKMQKKTKELLKYFNCRPAQICMSSQTISQLVRLFRNIQNIKRPSITLSLQRHLASWSEEEDEEGGFSMTKAVRTTGQHW